jgi:hypothetical protein
MPPQAIAVNKKTRQRHSGKEFFKTTLPASRFIGPSNLCEVSRQGHKGLVLYVVQCVTLPLAVMGKMPGQKPHFARARDS